MSEWPAFTVELARRLEHAFDEVRARLQAPRERLEFHATEGEWSNLEIAEHVVLVDHYLLILADKIAEKAGGRYARGERPSEHPSRLDHLEKLASREFKWASPEHMLPTGTCTASEIDARLGEQVEHGSKLLSSMPAGAGSLHRIRMSVVGDDDRLDLYQFLCVITLHASRHSRAMGRNEEAFARRTGR